ncbi:FkbM family methyltransferase [Campylobacter jejuni]|nr:FkbM family methyltransferase [Campylobacter jejuni]
MNIKKMLGLHFFGIPIIRRVRKVYASEITSQGLHLEYVRYTYKILGIVNRRTHSIVEANSGDINGIVGDKNNFISKINKIESMMDMFWLSNVISIPYNGQLGQDAIAYVIFKGKKEGFFIDIGANDGIEISNSLIFEQLGWKGLCVEANPITFEKLKKNRKCDLYNVAVFSENIGRVKLATTKVSGLDTLELNLTKEHQEKMLLFSNNDEIKYIEVDTITFGELMESYPMVQYIDFMSLDVEGGEFEVLKGIDFNKYSFGLITIEHNNVKNMENAIIKFMKEKGYRLFMYNYWDFMFVKDERIGWGKSGWWN